MERWPAEEDHFPFHYSMPQGFGVRNDDGPNHVEIFDIINIHSHHRAISETTCLCDIFGDDCESPTLSCSPASDFLTMKEVDDFTLADDSNNESSGSYHTAVCSEQLSDSSETFEDSTETHAPASSDSVLLSSPENIDSCSLTSTSFEPSNIQSTGTSPTLEHTDLPLQSNGTTDRISPSIHPGNTDIYNSRNFGLPQNTTAILEKRESNHSPNPGCPIPLARLQTIAPTLMHRNTSSSLTPKITSPSCSPRNISPSLTSQITTPIPTPRNISPSLRLQTTSPIPAPKNTFSSLRLQITSPSPTPTDTPPSLRPQTTSPIPAPRNSSPLVSPQITSPSPTPTDTPPSLRPETTSPIPAPRNSSPLVSPQITSPSSTSTNTSPSSTSTNTSPSPTPTDTPPSLRPKTTSPIPAPRNSSPLVSPQITSPSSTSTNTSPSPTPTKTSTSPKCQTTSPIPTSRNRSPSLTHNITSPSLIPTDTSPSSTPTNTSISTKLQTISSVPIPRHTSLTPQITSPSATPTDTSLSLTNTSTSRKLHTPPIPTPRNVSPSLAPKITSPSPTLTNTSPSSTPTNISISRKRQTTSPIPTSRNTSPSLTSQITSPSPTPTNTSPAPRPQITCQSPILTNTSPSSTPTNTSTSPKLQTISSVPIPRHTSPSMAPQTTSPSPTDTSLSLTNTCTSRKLHTSPKPTPRNTFSSLTPQIRSPSPTPTNTSTSCKLHTSPISTPRNMSPSLAPQITSPSPTPTNTSISCKLHTSSTSTPRNMFPSLAPQITSPTPTNTSTALKLQTTSQIPTSRNVSPLLTPQITSPSPKLQTISLSPKTISPFSKLQSAFLSPGPRNASPSLKSQPASQLLTSGIALTSAKPQTTPPSATPSTVSPSLKSQTTCPSSSFGKMSTSTSPKPSTTALSPKPDPKTTGLSAESGDDTNGINLWPEPRKTDILSKPRSPSLSPKTWGTNFSPECKVTASAQEDTPLFKQNESNNSFSPELSGLNFSHQPCNTDRDSPAVGLGNNTKQKSFCSSESHSTLDTVLNKASANRESRLKGERNHCSPPTFEAAVNPNSSSSGSPCTAEHNNCPCRDRGDEVGEGNMAKNQWGEEGEGKWVENCYREEQVELSFIAKNRKVPVSHSPPATYRRPQTRMPARCYSECLLATRQQQHQNSFRPQRSQHDHPSGSRKPQVLPKTADSSNINSTPDCASGSSSMGSELDETDNEVKWFTDLAFKSLSTPQVDYLDVYNSSHRSSTNMSQPSTEDSTGANAWSAYADLRGSVRYENDELLRQPPTAFPSDGLKKAKRFEMGSFECVDVALESGGETCRGKKTVPKRQIQLKKRDTCEPPAQENSGDTAEASSTHKRHSKDVFLRQHSTPAAVEEESYKSNSDLGNRKQKLQKSVSLDETSGKTKMATCFIKNVLSKKMQQEHKDTSQQVPFQNRVISPSEPISETADTSQSSIKQTIKTEVSSLSSEVPSECTLSSEDLPGNLSKQPETCNSNPQQRPSCKFDLNPLQSSTVRSDSHINDKGGTGKRSELLIPFENKKNKKLISREDIKQLTDDNLREKNSSDSASAISSNTSEAATRPPSTQSGMTNRDKECHAKPDNHKQQSARNIFTSKTPEITLKSSIAGEQKKTSIKVPPLSPGPEIMPSRSPDIHSAKREGKQEGEIENPTVNEAGSGIDVDPGTNKTKGSVHKVKDVRKMVKNTYSLSFKATAATAEDSNPTAQEEKLPAHPPPMQIEFKAISRKEEKAPVSASVIPQKGDKAQQEPSSQTIQEKARETASIHITPRNVPTGDMATSELHEETPDAESSKADRLGVSESNRPAEKQQKESERAPKLSGPAKLPCKDREISTLILLQDGQTNDPTAPPPLSLTTTSSSRSVSMLLKENCFQADIGLCDAPNGSQLPTPKHVNRLEVPLPSRPVEDIGPGAKKETILGSTPTRTNISPKLVPPLETKGEPLHKEPLTPGKTDMGKISRKSPLRETQAVTSLSAMSSYTQRQSVTEETHTTSYIQESTVVATSSNTGQPVVTVTTSFKQSPAPASSPQQSNIASTQEQVMSVASSISRTTAAPTTTQAPSYIKEPGSRAPMRHQPYVDKYRFYNSDDPPSYDERESFSPLHLTDLPPRRLHRYHPTCQVPPCACAQETLLSSGQPSLQPSNIAPPAAPLLRPQDACYPQAAPPASQHEPGSDVQPVNLQPASPQVTQPRTLQAPAPFQSLQHPPAVPAYPGPLMQPRPEDSRQPGQRTDRQVLHPRPPQQPTQLIGGSPYGSHTQSPTSLESRPPYLSSPQSFTASFSPEYSSDGPGDSGVLYPESGSSLFGQSPRRVLLDPETGKYFYVEVPVQPLRKMLLDPETGQYVEVLIPQSGLYPPSAVPYPSLHSPSMYPPQYMPYSVSPHPPTQPPRHPEVPAPPALHQTNTSFGNPGTQGSKRESQKHPPLDQSYLESMYYVPTGMTASPNPTPPDFYHKLPPRPNSEGKRS
ncbi:mucin-17-like isoform X2 [Brienomyrus brachyistius]|uniref:mucin-17-like isoform X2 n=1 Tax=Brienomyrus brachyistius TaxID=42636 RepID=UPI0020B2DCF7|nr:mucin-17-like isoform X2 [Brienomyrus brachyistius]